MANMNHLRDLLVHDVHDLYSAEEQIIAAMPAMIAKATNPQLKQSLEQHLRVTEQQLQRLTQVKQMLGTTDDDSGDQGIFAGLFGSGSKCKGMNGIISEGEEVMAIDMDSDVMDAAIICAAQKVEHYEICGYGTARAYAEQLGLIDVAQLLQQTLMEEHDADDRLTALAVGNVNIEAANEGSSMNMHTTASNTPSNGNM